VELDARTGKSDAEFFDEHLMQSVPYGLTKISERSGRSKPMVCAAMCCSATCEANQLSEGPTYSLDERASW
jgi:hypothetical protein